MNYTALGATVNLAARLEGLNKNYGTLILVSSALQQRTASQFVFRSVDRISPKGFAEAFEIYELRCARGEDDAAHVELCREWEVVYAALRHGPLAVAESELAAFLAKYPEDGVARYHRKGGFDQATPRAGERIGLGTAISADGPPLIGPTGCAARTTRSRVKPNSRAISTNPPDGQITSYPK